MSAEDLDRDPEIKLGPAANAMERREMRMAVAEGRDYEPVTERGRAVYAARQAREMLAEVRERLELARETYGLARDEGQGRVSAGLAALRTAAGKDRAQQDSEQIRERLVQIVERDKKGQEIEAEPSADRKLSVREMLENVLGRERTAYIEEPGKDQHDLEKEREVSRDRGL